MLFEEAMKAMREGKAVTRKDAKHYLRLFEDGLYMGFFETPDANLKPAHWIREQSICADDWEIFEGGKI